MSPKKISFKKIDYSKYEIYLKKAEDFYSSMFLSFTEKNWNSVGLEAVHCAISATDALLVRRKGVRSTSQDHRDLIDFMVEQINTEDARKYSNTLLRIISMKNIVEYEDRPFREKEATDILKCTERYFKWIKSQML
ncbi:MAG: hypothetical protein A2297_03640 [Elusimicrobia bacterium RIFOXYB2_FULL_48_7]|nr:MAG: hypothetical protein A2297_03640 [Elusimicrobia bacterium RIFOXYB2_FULL_48_7]